jgi:hypothetical protein
MLGFLIGFACGYFFILIGQLGLERGYSRDGIAKIYGKYYRLKPLNEDEIGGGENVE